MFLSLLEKRRSIRKFKAQPIEATKIDVLVEAALRAPSSRGFNPWEFIVVTQPEFLTALAKAKPHGAAFLAEAPLGLVICGDPKRSDVWVEDTAIASAFVHVAAVSLGLGSCWIQIRKRMCDEKKTASAHVRGVLGIPETLEVESIIAVGYPEESKPGHAKADLPYAKVYANQYGRRFSTPTP
jgi:nitroreductase